MLYVFCDGPRCSQDVEPVEATRREVQRVLPSESNIVFREENWGLGKSIIEGTNRLTEKFGTVIVIEDDLVTSKYFLKYMQDALNLYADAEQVMQISGHMFPVEIPLKDDAFFLPFTTSWGWATWRRAWKHFDPEMRKLRLLDESSKLRHQFDLNGSFPYFKMACNQRRGMTDSWAIRWYLSVFFNRGLTLYPTSSLVSNIGFDGTGTHCASEKTYTTFLDHSVDKFPSVELNVSVANRVFHHLRHQNRWWYKLWRRSLANLA